MSFFTREFKLHLKNQSLFDAFFKNGDYEIIETIDTIVKYHIENEFSFTRKIRKSDSTVLSEEIYRVPHHTITPTIEAVYAYDKANFKKKIILTNPNFGNAFLSTEIEDAELCPSFSQKNKVTLHTSLIAEEFKVLEEKANSLVLLNTVIPHLDIPLLTRENSSPFLNEYIQSRFLYNEKKVIPKKLDNFILFTKVLDQKIIPLSYKGIEIGAYNVLTVYMPFEGKGEVILKNKNGLIPNVVGQFCQFKITESTSSFLPLSLKNQKLNYNYDELISYINDCFNYNRPYSPLLSYLDDSVKVFKESLLVATKKETAIESLYFETFYKKHTYKKIKSRISILKKIIKDELDEDRYFSYISASSETKKLLSYWQKILKDYDDTAFNKKKELESLDYYDRFIDKICITLTDEDTAIENIFIVMNANNKITEIHFSSIPIYVTSPINSNSSYDDVNLKINFSSPHNFEKSSTTNYFFKINSIENILNNINERFDYNFFNEYKTFIHSLLEELKNFIFIEDIEKAFERISKIYETPRILHLINTNEKEGLIQLFISELLINISVLAHNAYKSKDALLNINATEEAENIYTTTLESFSQEFFNGDYFDIRKYFLDAIVYFQNQESSRDSALENLIYVTFLYCILREDFLKNNF